MTKAVERNDESLIELGSVTGDTKGVNGGQDDGFNQIRAPLGISED